jgi:hypothetical protein
MSQKQILIGLVGRKQSGKSIVAAYLTDTYGFVEYSLAEPLKRACMEIFGLTEEQVYVNKEQIDPYWGVSPRVLLQTVGTDLFRNELPLYLPSFDSTIWVRALEKKILSTPPNIPIVVSDIRFHDEHAFIKEHGGITIRIDRHSLFDTHTNTHPNDTHESETQDIDNVDYVIYNTGTLYDLFRNVDAIVSTLV